MIELTKEFLVSHGWKEGVGVVCKDFRDCEGRKYRIGWNTVTHILYVGYGQLPNKIESLEDLISVLKVFKFNDEVMNLEKNS